MYRPSMRILTNCISDIELRAGANPNNPQKQLSYQTKHLCFSIFSVAYLSVYLSIIKTEKKSNFVFSSLLFFAALTCLVFPLLFKFVLFVLTD